MTIPEVREALLRLADRQPASVAEEIRRLVKEMHRRPYVRRAPATRHGRPSKEQVEEFLRIFPDAGQQMIGAAFGVDGGRVSEALHGTYRNGKRALPIPPTPQREMRL